MPQLEADEVMPMNPKRHHQDHFDDEDFDSEVSSSPSLHVFPPFSTQNLPEQDRPLILFSANVPL